MSDRWKACAVPWKLVLSVAGRRMSRSTSWICSTACAEGTPGRRLKEIVTAGQLAQVVDGQRAHVRVSLATAPSGTSLPLEERM